MSDYLPEDQITQILTRLGESKSMSVDLPEDLITQILTRLPAMSLLRFKSVSKSWRRLISSSDFVRLHTLQAAQNLKLMIRRVGNRKEIYTLHAQDKLSLNRNRDYIGIAIAIVEFPFPGFDIVGSANGIFCLTNDYLHQDIILWNPSIKRKLNLPRVSYFRASNHESVAIGFGFDTTVDDHKAAKITYRQTDGVVLDSWVYSLKGGRWSRIASPAPSFYGVNRPACFADGALHWLRSSYLKKDVDYRQCHIIKLDLGDQLFGTIMLPECPEGLHNLFVARLIVIQESLGVTFIDGYSFNIWVLRENNAWSWVSTFGIAAGMGGTLNQFQHLGNDCSFLIKDETASGRFKVYNQVTGVCCTFAMLRNFSRISDVVNYSESLALLDQGETYQSVL